MNSQMVAPGTSGLGWWGDEWVMVHAWEGGRRGRLPKASEGKLSAVQSGFSLNLSALCCDVQIRLSWTTSLIHLSLPLMRHS